jgi:hypothetical protein
MSSRFTLHIAKNPLDNFDIDANVLFTYPVDNGTYSTSIDGGYKTAFMEVYLPPTLARIVYSKVLGKKGVVYDELGNRVFEGKITKCEVGGKGIKMFFVGFYSQAKDLHFGLVYPTSTPTSISDVIEDVIDVGNTWDTSKAFVENTITDITPLDFTGEKKLKDAIEEVLKFGNDDSPPKRMHFQVWDDRVCHLSSETDVDTDDPDYIAWVVPGTNGAVATTLSIDNIFNKIQVLYDDPDLDGADFSAWYSDLESQDLYGLVEGSYSLGESTSNLAILVAQMLLTRYAKPEQSFTLNINRQTGYIKGKGGRKEHLMRAGQVVRVDSVDTAVDFGDSDNPGRAVAQGIVFSTSYNIGSGAISITLGTKAAAFDFLMTRLGYSVGSMS